MKKSRFIIAGERRSGSSSLYELLKKHPDVAMFHQGDYNFFMPPELFDLKEPAFVSNWEHNHTLNDYENFFESHNCNAYKDADLLWWRDAHKRIAEYDSDCKFVFILREPIKRAESHYLNEVQKGRETRSFDAALSSSFDDLSEWEALHLCYKERGNYAQSLKHFFQFVDQRRVKIVILEDLFNERASQVKELCEFLGISFEKIKQIDQVHSNKELAMARRAWAKEGVLKGLINGYERITEAVIVRATKHKDYRSAWRRRLRFFYQESLRDQFEMDAEIRNELKNFYTPCNKELEDVLGRKLRHWNYD